MRAYLINTYVCANKDKNENMDVQRFSVYLSIVTVMQLSTP